MVNFLSTYQKVTKYPFGKFIFNKGIGFVSPFFGKLRPNVIDLKPAFCIVEIKDRHGLRNHIGTVNAGAMCSLAELTAGMAVDAATKLNLEVQKSIGKTETKHLLDETGYGEIKNIEDLKILMELACLLYTPEDNKNTVEVIDDSTIMLYVWDCYVHKMVSKAGNIGIHQCSSRPRCESWLKGMGLNGEVIHEKNINNCNGDCEIVFKITW